MKESEIISASAGTGAAVLIASKIALALSSGTTLSTMTMLPATTVIPGAAGTIAAIVPVAGASVFVPTLFYVGSCAVIGGGFLGGAIAVAFIVARQIVKKN